MRKKSIIIIFAVFISDQITKYFIVKNFYLGESAVVIENVFHITYITNTGTAFGMFQKYGNILLVFSVVAIILILILVFKQKTHSLTHSLALSLILGGAFGNLFDRLFRGKIIDFLDFRIWPIFNIADSAITVGIIILFIHSIIAKKTT
ncbi:MAG: signal peptidase II [Elusimicrobia bacterium CG06_land_8_20_14_3_00_38_11]|nr:MAG: signal peptidase II [Elusimicrobia bacterium CG06_land_8_20_14_3_00_38_11]